MSDNPKEANKEMEKALFVSADCWLDVFHLLPPSQLGLGIAMISRRFDYFIDEHFKTRKWTLGSILIRKIGTNGKNELKISKSNLKALPIPQKPLPSKVIGFGSIDIRFIDHNVLTFLRRFERFFASCTTTLAVETENVRISEFVLRNIWPMLKNTFHTTIFNPIAFHRMRQLLAPSMLNDCQSLHNVSFDGAIFPEFPPDDSANASDGQAVAKWLFTPRPENLPKQLDIVNSTMEQWLTNVEQIKTEFSNAFSPVNFLIFIEFPPPFPIDSIASFKRTNEFTGEQLTLTAIEEDANVLKLKRCPIAEGSEEKWQKALNEWFWATQKKRIDIWIGDDGVDEGLLDVASAGSSGDQKEQKK